MGPAPSHHLHLLGIIRILQYCGPETFENAELLCVFRACRSVMVSLVICSVLCLLRWYQPLSGGISP